MWGVSSLIANSPAGGTTRTSPAMTAASSSGGWSTPSFERRAAGRPETAGRAAARMAAIILDGAGSRTAAHGCRGGSLRLEFCEFLSVLAENRGRVAIEDLV